jgi:hypothetical protein
MENGIYSKLGVIFYLMKLPINENELNTIIKALLLGGDTALYQKLCTFRINHIDKQKSSGEIT